MSSTFRQSAWSSLRSTLNDSGRPGSSVCSPLTIASYMRVRPMTSSRLDGEELLQRVGRAVGLHRPDFHLAETLTAELRLATERLLGDERVRTNRARVDLVVDQVVELEHVHDAHGDLVIERLAGPAVEEHRLAAGRETGDASSASLIAVFGRAVEDRRRVVHALLQLAARPDEPLRCVSLLEQLGDVLVAVEDLEDVLLDLRVAELVVQMYWSCQPSASAAQPRWVSRIWPTFIRLGTPSGLSTMSTGRPSSMYGMSSSGRMRETTPLLP